MQGHTAAPDFEDYLAKHLGESCALQVATREFEQAVLAFRQWEAQRLRYALDHMPR